MDPFKDRVAVITGGAGSIGMAMARAFIARGARVVLADLDPDALARAVEELKSSGAQALGVRCDVTKPDSVQQLADATFDHYGAAHIVCNNAGVAPFGMMADASRKDWEFAMNVNVWGVIHGIRTFIPIMLEQDTEGHIVNTASMAGVTNGPFSAPYYMSKHAVLSLSESIYHELKLAGAKIGVSALCPEIVATNIDHARRNRPAALQRKGAPPAQSDVVEAALSSFIGTGTPPAVIAQRVLEAVRDDRFYILSEDAWRRSCETRLEDVRLGRNPTFDVPVS